MGAPAPERESTTPTAVTVRPRGPLVGRRAELERLGAALDEAAAGRGELVLVVGEGGIGKTRLAEAVAADAAARGCSVLWGSAWDAGGAPAYWPWTQVIRALLTERPREEIREDVAGGAPYVAQIAPEVGRELGVEPAPRADTEDARFTAFDAVASFLRAAAARRPLLVVLDDLHAADVATLRLLEFVARGLRDARIVVVGTYRGEEVRRDRDAGAALGAVAQAGRRLPLGGLSREEVADLAAAGAPDGAAPGWLVDRVHALTEGNPLFVDEVMRLLAAEGALTAPDRFAAARLPLPDGVRDTIRRRLEPLGADVVRTLGAAAVIGPEFQVQTLAPVLAADPAALLEHLDTAAAAQLVEEAPGTAGRYRFAHALVRETLYEDLGSRERVALHAAVGEVLAARHGDDADAPFSELAHHFLQAAPGGHLDRAAHYAHLAGEHALAAMAYEQAVQFLGDALGALELQPPEPQRRARTLLLLGEAEMRAGRLEAGRRTLRRAADVARRLGDGELLAHAALSSAPWGLATGLADEQGLVPLLEEALDCVPGDDSALRARLLARLAAALYWSAPFERRSELAEQAIAMARRVGDASTLALVLSDAHLATWDPDSPVRSMPWAEEISALAERIGNMELAMDAHSWRISLLLELGDVARVDAEMATFARTASEVRQPRAQAVALIHGCARALVDGRFDDAERLLTAAAEYALLLQQDQFLGMRLGGLAFVMRHAQDRLPELEPAIRAYAEAHPAMPVWRCGLLAVHRQAGRDDELRRDYDRLAANGFAALVRDNLYLPAVALLAEACAHLRDADGAHALIERLEPYAGRNVATPDVAFVGPVDRYLALLYLTTGDHERAAAHFASARALLRGMGARPAGAQLDLDEAQALRERDPGRAAALAAAAAAAAEDLGLPVLARHAHEVGSAPAALAAAGPAPAVAAPDAAPAILRRRGDLWDVCWSGEAFGVKDVKGLRYLAQLLERPGQELHALDIATPEAAGDGAGGAVDPALSIRARGSDDAGAMLDARAKAEYRRRIEELREELEEAEAFNDPERAGRARDELEFLGRELAAAVGLGGRDRRAASAAERARVNVTRAIRTVVERMAQEDEALGHHLRTCVRTGTFCVYDPGPDARAWDVDAG